MNSSIPVYTILLPEYTVEQQPDYLAVGGKLDAVLATHFSGRKIAVRGISLSDHPGWSLEALVATILRLGTDRYDPQRKGALHDFYEPYNIDMHALPCTVSDAGPASSHCAEPSVMAEVVADFYTGPPADRGYACGLRVDLLMIYDWDQLEGVPISYGWDPEPEPCAFRFKYPEQKQKALLGVIKVLR